MSHWISYYRRCQGDRLHYFKCRPGPATGHYIQYCSWTGYLNYPTQAYFQGCANNGFIAGVISVYDPITSDRKYCEGRGKAAHSLCCFVIAVMRAAPYRYRARWVVVGLQHQLFNSIPKRFRGHRSKGTHHKAVKK